MRQVIELEIKTEAIPDRVAVWPDEMVGLPRRQFGVTPPVVSASGFVGEPLRGQGEATVPME
jgi:hypothetical protein